jgi:hypothetical protein
MEERIGKKFSSVTLLLGIDNDVKDGLEQID